MIRFAISVEGSTEEEFSKAVLAPHLRSHGIEAQPILLGRARGSSRGGNVSVERLTAEMVYLYRSFDAVTSLVDFYGFRKKHVETVEELEMLLCQKIQHQIGSNQNRILPYVQKHEFEGLLFSGVGAFTALTETSPQSIDLLRQVRSSFTTPEDINDNKATAPSKRIKNVIPRYRKPLHGPLVAMRIGLALIRTQCPRFDNWMTSLEGLQGRP